MEYLENTLCSAIRQHIADNLSAYPSQEFLQQGVADIRFEKAAVKKIRIYHTTYKYLLLRGIKLFADGGLIEGKDIPGFTASSGALHKNMALDIRFNEIAKPYMVRTTSLREDAFVEIEFDRPISVDQIILYTGKGQKGIRDNCLAVDIVNGRGKKLCV